MTPHQLVQRYPVISDQVSRAELVIILQQLTAVLEDGIAGDVVEFGCYIGTTSLFLQRLLQQQAFERQLYVYDSFAGLPPKTPQDSSPAGLHFVSGELSATKSQFTRHFKKAGLSLPVIKKAWFSDVALSDLPEAVALAFLDGDYYESVRLPLTLLECRLSHGAMIIVDDYHSEALPGVTTAVDNWLRLQPAVRLQVVAGLAIMRWP